MRTRRGMARRLGSSDGSGKACAWSADHAVPSDAERLAAKLKAIARRFTARAAFFSPGRMARQEVGALLPDGTHEAV